MRTRKSTAKAATGKQRLLRGGGLLVSILSLGGVVWWGTHQETPELPKSSSELGVLSLAIAIFTVATLLRGERAYRLLAAVGASPSRSDAYALTVVAYMGNTILPARGGDAMRVYLQAPRAQTSMRNVIGTVIAERVIDVVTLLSLFALLAFGVLRGIEAPGGSPLTLIAVVVLTMLALVAVVCLCRNRPAVRRIIDYVTPMTTATRQLRGAHGARMLTLTLGIWTAEVATWQAVAVSTGLEIGVLEAIYLVALTGAFVLIPAGPGYAGTLDAGVIFGVRAVGGSSQAAISYLLALRFVLLVPITLAGLIIVLVRYGGWSAARSLRALPPDGRAGWGASGT